MRKGVYLFLGFVLMGASLIIGSAGTARAEVNVNINIGAPPVVVSAPRSNWVVISGMPGIYFVSGYDFEVYYYSGAYWSYRGNGWYKQSKGKWISMRNNVPGKFFTARTKYNQQKGRSGKSGNPSQNKGSRGGKH